LIKVLSCLFVATCSLISCDLFQNGGCVCPLCHGTGGLSCEDLEKLTGEFLAWKQNNIKPTSEKLFPSRDIMHVDNESLSQKAFGTPFEPRIHGDDLHVKSALDSRSKSINECDRTVPYTSSTEDIVTELSEYSSDDLEATRIVCTTSGTKSKFSSLSSTELYVSNSFEEKKSSEDGVDCTKTVVLKHFPEVSSSPPKSQLKQVPAVLGNKSIEKISSLDDEFELESTKEYISSTDLPNEGNSSITKSEQDIENLRLNAFNAATNHSPKRSARQRRYRRKSHTKRLQITPNNKESRTRNAFGVKRLRSRSTEPEIREKARKIRRLMEQS